MEKFTESENYKSVFRFLNVSCKGDILEKLKNVIRVAKEPSSFVPKDFVENLDEYYDLLEDASVVTESFSNESIVPESVSTNSSSARVEFAKVINIKMLIQNFLKLNNDVHFQALRSRATMTTTSPYKEALKKCINYLDKEVFSVFLKHPTQVPGWEIFCFKERSHMIKHVQGPMKGAIFNALNNPCQYLEVL